MDNDDEFEYDDDFDYEVESGSDGDDENIRQEIELDNIKSSLKSDPSNAVSQLESLALRYTSPVCVDAALQLFRLKPSVETFTTLVQTTANAPASVEDYSRSSSFEEAARLLEQHPDVPQQQVVEAFASAVSVLRPIQPSRVYMQALIRLCDIHLKLGDLDSAWRVMTDDLEPGIQSMNAISAPQFRFDSLVLKVKLCMAAEPIKRPEIRRLLAIASKIPHGTRSLRGNINLQQVEGLVKIEEGQLTDAKTLLNESFKGHTEGSTLQQDRVDSSNAAFALILVSTVLGAGDFDPLVEIPMLESCSEINWDLKLALDIAFAFRHRDAHAIVILLRQLEQRFAESRCQLGQREILQSLRASFLAMQLRNTLRPYSRIKWDTLVQRVGTQLDMTNNDFDVFVLENELPGIFKKNALDHTIDRMPSYTRDWRVGPESEQHITVPLPSHYVEYFDREAQQKKEDRILSKWKRNQPAQATTPAPRNRVAHETVYTMLNNSMENHFEAMSY